MDLELLLKFVKFCIVGFSGLIIDFGITYVLKEKAQINRFVANSIGFTSAVVNNYIFNKVWTFSDTNPEIVEQFTKFFLISMGGLVINNLIIYLLEKRVNFYLAKLIAIIVVVIWNFIMNYKYSFN